jgi:hypothetical protein
MRYTSNGEYCDPEYYNEDLIDDEEQEELEQETDKEFVELLARCAGKTREEMKAILEEYM